MKEEAGEEVELWYSRLLGARQVDQFCSEGSEGDKGGERGRDRGRQERETQRRGG